MVVIVISCQFSVSRSPPAGRAAMSIGPERPDIEPAPPAGGGARPAVVRISLVPLATLAVVPHEGLGISHHCWADMLDPAEPVPVPRLFEPVRFDIPRDPGKPGPIKDGRGRDLPAIKISCLMHYPVPLAILPPEGM